MNFESIHTLDYSTVGVEAVPADESKLFWKLKEERSWRPYCMKCSTMARMARKSFGFKCISCQNEVNWDMSHHDA